MEECIFCKIARGEISTEKIYEDDSFIAFADTNPVGEGHTLVIPKKHFYSLMDLDDESSKEYIFVIKNVGKLLMEKYDAQGFNVVLNNGGAAGQIVKHVHFHILPRKEGDKRKGIFIG